MTKKANHLIDSESPYLLQHAYNPVNWHQWGDIAIQKAKKEDKPIILSIGYSACHWCHVMERECFENEQIAELMNRYFICIKVDREERPDIDAIYIEAVQAMGGQAGWPLNVFLMPDMRPFYGGTYFPAAGWTELLTRVGEAFSVTDHRQQLDSMAEKVNKYLNVSELDKFKSQKNNHSIENDFLEKAFEKLSQNFDFEAGGFGSAPKFPTPSIYFFLLEYYHLSKNPKSFIQVKFTLDKMARGGIYDQIGGGFSRYSVDKIWFAPHFEKMLYDNAQLISLYSKMYSVSKSKLYKNVVYQSIDFIKRELKHENGAFYAALDADSEGEEGKFYTWNHNEIQKLVGDDFNLIQKYYGITKEGNWEEVQKNILHCKISNEEFIEKYGSKFEISLEELEKKVQNWQKILLQHRNKRIRPALDFKILTSWNAMMCTALIDAYAVFGEDEFLSLALKNSAFIEQNLLNGDELLHAHTKKGQKITAYLEDYASLISAYISLYQVCFDEKYLEKAVRLSDYCLANFYDEKSELFYFTNQNAEKLIARKKEIFDSVMPSSNSVMLHNLDLLSHILDKENYAQIAQKMFDKIVQILSKDILSLSNWARFYVSKSQEKVEIAIIGKEYKEFAQEISKHYLPNKIIVACKESSELSLLKNRLAIEGKTTIYVCKNKICNLPVFSIEDAILQINS